MSVNEELAKMNNNLRSMNMNANPTKSDLLRELGNETGTARRQDLLKATWRLNRHRAQPVSRQFARPQAAATVAPEAQLRNPRSVREPDRRRNPRSESPNATAPRQSAHNKSLEMMTDKQTFSVLNQLYAIERFSLANYLRYAKPWVSAADQCLAEAIRHIGDQQLEFSEQVGSLIVERRGHVVGDSFPLRFTAYNDLSLAYLAPRVMEDQERIVRQVRAIAHQLRGDLTARDLATEILAAEQAHLDDLRELLSLPKSEPCRESAVVASGERRREDATQNVATAA